MSHYAFNWFALPPLVTALCSLLTGLMLYRREWTSRVGQALMGVTFAIAFWFVASGMLYLSVDESTALLWARISYIAVPLLPATVFLYISIGLRSYDKQKMLVWVVVPRRPRLRRHRLQHRPADIGGAPLLVGLLPRVRWGG